MSRSTERLPPWHGLRYSFHVAEFIAGILLVDILRVILATLITVGIGLLIGLALRRFRRVRYLARLILIAPWLTALYIVIGIVIAIVAVASNGEDSGVSNGLSILDDVVHWPMYVLWFLAALGIPAWRRWRRMPTAPDVSVALG